MAEPLTDSRETLATDLESDPARASPTTTASRYGREVVAYCLLGGLCILTSVLARRPFPDGSIAEKMGYFSHTLVVGFQIGILFAPSVILYYSVCNWMPSWARVLANGLSTMVAAAYTLDVLVYPVIGDHLFSNTAWSLASAVARHITQYVTPIMFAKLLGAIVAWWIVAFVLWRIAKKVSTIHRKPATMRDHLAVAGILTVIGAIGFGPPLYHLPKTLAAIRKSPSENPITLLGVLSNRVPIERASTKETQLIGHVVMTHNSEAIARRQNAYQQLRYLATTEPSGEAIHRPDIVIVLSECLRSDILSRDGAPNFHRLASKGIWASNHYSGGNASAHGMFTFFTGLEACWYERAGELPLGLVKMLQDSGYEVGMFGKSDFFSFKMDTFIHSDNFDRLVLMPGTDDCSIDRKAVWMGEQFLNEDVGSRPLGKPRAAIVYQFSPHFPYTHEPDDIPSQPNDRLGADYWRAVHFVDRITARLFSDDRVVLVLGDHGESFGEDHRGLHGTAFSDIQCKTIAILAGPGVPHKRIRSITSHVDILPTLMELLGVEPSDDQVLPGRSMLGLASENEADKRVFVVRQSGMDTYLYVDSQPEVSSVGAFSFSEFTASPMQRVDPLGQTLTASNKLTWNDVADMQRWVIDFMQDENGSMPADPYDYARQTLLHGSDAEKICVLTSLQTNLTWAERLKSPIEDCLGSSNEDVRRAAMDTLLTLQRSMD